MIKTNQEQLERLQEAIKKYGKGGKIMLPKNEDKYDVFKEWFANNDEVEWYSTKHNVSYIGDEPFQDFEREYDDLFLKEEIKEIIRKNIRCKYEQNGYNSRLLVDINGTAESIYKLLKERGYLNHEE